MSNVIAFDLGNLTGVAASSRDGVITACTIEWMNDKAMKAARSLDLDRRSDPRVLRFFDYVRNEAGRFEVVVFEDVKFQTYTYQTQLWSSYRAALWCGCYCCPNPPKIIAVPVGALKQWAAGHGGADKDAMACALVRMFPDRYGPVRGKAGKRFKLFDKIQETNLDDNAIDAALLNVWAQKHVTT